MLGLFSQDLDVSLAGCPLSLTDGRMFLTGGLCTVTIGSTTLDLSEPLAGCSLSVTDG